MKDGDETKAHRWLKRLLGKRRRARGMQEEAPAGCWQHRGVVLALTEATQLLRGRPASHWEADGEEDPCFAVELEEAVTQLEIAIGDYALAALNRHPVLLPDAAGDWPVSNLYPGEDDQAPWNRHSSKMTPQEAFVGDGDDSLQQCAEAMADCVAWNMRQEWTVSEFRQQALGDALLTEADAWDFLTSPLPKVLPLEDYERLGLCPATATGRVTRTDGSSIGKTVWAVLGEIRDGKMCLDYLVELDLPDGSVHRQTVTSTRLQYQCVGWPQKRPLLKGGAEVLHNSAGGFFMPVAVPFEGTDAGERFVEAMGESVTAGAMVVCRRLMALHPVTIWDALRFLLTDLPPAAAPWLATAHAYSPWRPHGAPWPGSGQEFWAAGPVTLNIQPWVRPDQVAAYWKALRGPSHRTLPRPHNVRLFRFVLRHTPAGSRPCWGALEERWREETGEALGRNVMQTVFRRVRKTLLPGYQEEWEEPDD